jgi:hypothetical protein
MKIKRYFLMNLQTKRAIGVMTLIGCFIGFFVGSYGLPSEAHGGTEPISFFQALVILVAISCLVYIIIACIGFFIEEQNITLGRILTESLQLALIFILSAITVTGIFYLGVWAFQTL